MRLGQFILLSVLAALAIGILSYGTDAGAGTIAARVIATIVILQVGYFAVLLALATLRPKTEEHARNDGAEKPGNKAAPPAQD